MTLETFSNQIHFFKIISHIFTNLKLIAEKSMPTEVEKKHWLEEKDQEFNDRRRNTSCTGVYRILW